MKKVRSLRIMIFFFLLVWGEMTDDYITVMRERVWYFSNQFMGVLIEICYQDQFAST